ncbi:MAG: ferrochelatase, partial [Actinomycetota bacterium]|nr:ferrochelatase [Actinomycetota bacterium]
MSERSAVLVMAYGTPRDLDDVEAYYTDIRHGRPPPPHLLHELQERYRAIGGRSPLLEITRLQVRGIAQRVGVEGYVGQKHASPFIRDAVAAMEESQVQRAVGIVLAPHFSSMSIGDYKRRALRAAEEVGWKGRLDFVDSWHLEPGYIDFLASEVALAVRSLPENARDDAVVLFTAHSLPEKILQGGDPYPRQLEETAEAVAGQAGLQRWEVAWQSAGRTD